MSAEQRAQTYITLRDAYWWPRTGGLKLQQDVEKLLRSLPERSCDSWPLFKRPTIELFQRYFTDENGERIPLIAPGLTVKKNYT